ncbi:MAG TPA: hypothetical protein PLI62_16240 [Spirochaetota bacterium]|nr:hypothetical protein [Spirochaetota bacterium]HQP47761.1 hypothetical protein [Spirochaetota bacterium]
MKISNFIHRLNIQRSGLILFLLLAMAVLPTGCLMKYTHPGGIMPSYHPMEDRAYEDAGWSTGETSSFHLLWAIPVTPALSLDRAVKEAIHAKGGDNMTDIRWWYATQHWIVGTVCVVHVKGKVIRYRTED